MEALVEMQAQRVIDPHQEEMCCRRDDRYPDCLGVQLPLNQDRLAQPIEVQLPLNQDRLAQLIEEVQLPLNQDRLAQPIEVLLLLNQDQLPSLLLAPVLLLLALSRNCHRCQIQHWQRVWPLQE